MSCGCGAGDAGCADCGCCRACEAIPKETFATNDDNEASMLPLNRMAYNAAQQLNYCDPLNADMHRFATAFAMVDGGIIPAAIAANDLRNKEHDYEELPAVIRGSIRGDVPVSRLNPRIERRRIGIDVLGRRLRHASKAYRNLVGGAANGRAIPVDGIGENGASNVELIDKIVSNVINIDIDQGSDGETSKLTPIPPTKLSIPSRIIQIACGLHHSVLLTSSGDVLTFGSNQFGQLGHNDFAIREVPTKVLINATIVQIAAGSNHTVLLSSTGQVFTFGSNQKGQLGRAPSAIDFAWNAIPAIIPNIGQQYGRKATFISASGDHTFIKFDESLINPLSLSSARVIANRRCWGFSSHSIEAIRFMADNDILLGGFGLFGGRGEYTAKLKLFDIGMDGGEQEGDGEILAETEEIPFECAARQKYPILFDEPIPIQANRWYVAWARISGPSSDCGSSGQSVVNTEDQVTGIGFDNQVLSGHQLHVTPSRFSRISQNRTWNTGNGSPDAICFSVDRPGISIAGVTVYGGIGNEWHYELELLDYIGATDERLKNMLRLN
ncbi:unnamed protein product [Sphagnum jensenii]|uniref:PHR domain-containing protein n=1 Tax=Sphagnum jensenii TaxID=128206 RepID=A0ABP0VBI3_9BRYO